MRLRRRSVHGKYVSKPRTHSTPHSVEKNGQYGTAINARTLLLFGGTWVEVEVYPLQPLHTDMRINLRR